MIEEIIKFYQDEDHILSMIDVEEFQYLKKILDKGQVLYTEVPGLCRKELVVMEFGDYVQIPEELEESIQNAIKHANLKKIQDKQDYRDFAKGLLYTHGALPYSNFIQMLGLFTEDFDINHASSVFQKDRYLDFCCCYDQDIVREMNFILDPIVEDCFEDILYVQTLYDQYTPSYDSDALKRIGKNRMDIENPHLAALRKALDFTQPWDMYVFKQFMSCCHLHEDLEEVLSEIFEFSIRTSEEWEELRNTMRAAYDDVPSAALNGISPREFERIKAEEKEMEKSLPKKIKQRHANLSDKETEIFYDVFFGLLEYANKKLRVTNVKKLYKQKFTDPAKVAKIRDVLFSEHRELIDQFVKDNPFHMGREELDLIKGFRQGVYGMLTIGWYEKDYTVIFHEDTVGYRVVGLHSNISEILQHAELPVICRGLLLPFGDRIVIDGLLSQMPLNMTTRARSAMINSLKELPIKSRLEFYEA